MMIQLNGHRGNTYTNIDAALMSILCKALSGVLGKMKAEMITTDSLSRTNNMLEGCKQR